MQTESEIQKEVMTFLKVCGFMAFRMNSGYIKKNVKLSPIGTPDIMAISPYGKTTWIEIKTETGKLRDSQIDMHAKLRSYDQNVIVARSVKDVEKIVK